MIGKLSKGLLNFFFQGILFLVPIAITIWAIVTLFLFIDGILKGYVIDFLGIDFPGLGLLILLVLITLIGFLGSSFLFKSIIAYFDDLMARVPLIKILYTSVKDLVGAFVGQKKRYTEPVAIPVFENSKIEKLGFITNRDLSLIGIQDGKVAVYLPHAYAWSGNLIIVPSSYIRPLEAKSTDVMKFIVSGGVTEFEETE